MTAKKNSHSNLAVDPNIMTAQILDETTPSSYSRFPIVGIGASAGGLAAFEAFFSAMPADIDSNMAFVLVQHLAPDHKSILAELIRKYTRMQVFEVVDGMKVQPNCAYIIPPNCDMAFLNGSLQLLEPSLPRGQRLPIDFFFRSLAADQQERAIGIVLSGTGSDGTLGARSIKGEGGMVIAQNPQSAEFDGMPRSIIATGLVDSILSPAEMPAQLISYAAHAFGKAGSSFLSLPQNAVNEMKNIFVLLRLQTGHDFSGYKQNTVNRRVERRMAVHQIDQLPDYVRYLQKNPKEVDALFNDLLIGVTNFFRDSETFAAFQSDIIPKLFAGKESGATVRVWVPGCSTGEEAYSIAIMLQEYLETEKQHFKLQVFATDIDKKSVEQARTGLYPASISADVSAGRLARFFSYDPAGSTYRIHKIIRDILVFSEQDVIKDPPFSKLDLISCRNLLIYLNADLQKRLIPLFHYALNPGGILLLGTSETVGDFAELFTVLDRQAKVFQKKELAYGLQRPIIQQYFPPLQVGTIAPSLKPVPAERKKSLREVAEQMLLLQYAPAALIINENGDILYIYGNAGRYLELASGEATLNIMKMVRSGLRRELSAALRNATILKIALRKENLLVKIDGSFSTIHLTVYPVAAAHELSAGQALFLIALEEAPTADTKRSRKIIDKNHPSDTEKSFTDDWLAGLKQELNEKEEFLQSAKEELEKSNEELKSANEEMQSVNEELQSTNEELETSKEELQSVNEELSTVNSELQTKVADLSRVNNDMNNLLAGTGVATIFVDHQQHVRRFTPSAAKVINLIPTDVGRPIGHIVANLVGYDSLVADIQSVLDTLSLREVEVQCHEGTWFLLRIHPYRTLENVIEGAVISFFDITEIKRVQMALQETSVKYRLLFDTLAQGVVFQDSTGRIIEVNSAAERILGLTLTQLKSNSSIFQHHKTIYETGNVFPPDSHPDTVAFKTGQAVQEVRMGIHLPGNEAVWLRVTSMPQFHPGEPVPYQVYTTFHIITDK
ncbi:MAG TPA: chemotaxis protein CheB [Patescibacteria group bacterium]|nr:chemotaxis protein CheB [Patescibacteria group bacterium]